MYQLKRLNDGDLVLKNENGENICGHQYPFITKLLVSCRQEIKNLLQGQKQITYEFIKKLNDPNNDLSIRIPVTDEYVKYMIETKNPFDVMIKNELTSNVPSDFFEALLTAFRESLFGANFLDKFQNYVQNFSDLEISGNRKIFIWKHYTEKHPTDIIYRVMKILLLDPVTRPHAETVKKMLLQKKANTVSFHFSQPIDVENFAGFIKDLITGKKMIWGSIGVKRIQETSIGAGHNNQMIIKNTGDQINVLIFDPWLVKKDVWTRNYQDRQKHRSEVLGFLKVFISALTKKRTIVKRKYLSDVCENDKSMQCSIDIGTGMCLLYGAFMCTLYLHNLSNPGIKNSFIEDDDDVTCFMCLVDRKALNLLGIFFYGLYRDNPDFRFAIVKMIKERKFNPSYGINVNLLQPLVDEWEKEENLRLQEIKDMNLYGEYIEEMLTDPEN